MSTPEGDTPHDFIAIMDVLQELALGKGPPGTADPAWGELVDAGITEALCDCVLNNVALWGPIPGVSELELERAKKAVRPIPSWSIILD